ncbi:MAG: hypothetical protein HYX42_21125 [Polaromonas sp.]|nr:hypothetical protein [Polaromonas sp.]
MSLPSALVLALISRVGSFGCISSEVELIEKQADHGKRNGHIGAHEEQHVSSGKHHRLETVDSLLAFRASATPSQIFPPDCVHLRETVRTDLCCLYALKLVDGLNKWALQGGELWRRCWLHGRTFELDISALELEACMRMRTLSANLVRFLDRFAKPVGKREDKQ